MATEDDDSPIEIKTLKFRGTQPELKEILASIDVRGIWSYEPNHVWRLIAGGGLLIFWSPGTWSLWLQGPHQSRLEVFVQLRARLRIEHPTLFGPRVSKHEKTARARSVRVTARKPRKQTETD